MPDREKLIEICRRYDGTPPCDTCKTPIGNCSMCGLERLIDYLIANGVTVRECGRWEQVERWATKAKYRCSVCGREIMSAVTVNIEKYPFCHCGADMRGEEDA